MHPALVSGTFSFIGCRNSEHHCIGFAWQVLEGGGYRVASVRICKKLPPCTMEPIPGGSKTDPPLAKVEPISNDGSASVIMS